MGADRMIKSRAMLLAAMIVATLSHAAGDAAARSTSVAIEPRPQDLEIGLWFDGAEATIRGSVNMEFDNASSGSPPVVVLLKGEDRHVIVRRKGRRWGMWLNVEDQRFERVPIFHALAVSTPGLEDHAALAPFLVRTALADQGPPDAFVEALIELKQADAFYGGAPPPIVVANGRFTARFHLPPSARAGRYTAVAMVLRDDGALISQPAEFTLAKAGIERWLHATSVELPLLYGLCTLLTAGLAGLLAHWAFGWVRIRVIGDTPTEDETTER
ncbi:MAG: TIGR02186 family protein [Pseudomonadota bacterium]